MGLWLQILNSYRARSLLNRSAYMPLLFVGLIISQTSFGPPNLRPDLDGRIGLGAEIELRPPALATIIGDFDLEHFRYMLKRHGLATARLWDGVIIEQTTPEELARLVIDSYPKGRRNKSSALLVPRPELQGNISDIYAPFVIYGESRALEWTHRIPLTSVSEFWSSFSSFIEHAGLMDHFNRPLDFRPGFANYHFNISIDGKEPISFPTARLFQDYMLIVGMKRSTKDYFDTSMVHYEELCMLGIRGLISMKGYLEERTHILPPEADLNFLVWMASASEEEVQRELKARIRRELSDPKGKEILMRIAREEPYVLVPLLSRNFPRGEHGNPLTAELIRAIDSNPHNRKSTFFALANTWAYWHAEEPETTWWYPQFHNLREVAWLLEEGYAEFVAKFAERGIQKPRLHHGAPNIRAGDMGEWIPEFLHPDASESEKRWASEMFFKMWRLFPEGERVHNTLKASVLEKGRLRDTLERYAPTKAPITDLGLSPTHAAETTLCETSYSLL